MASTILFIVGPSAVGKSRLGLAVAQALRGEIIACDAMQVYREIQIASDKPSAGDRALVPHHALDLVSVTEHFDAAMYRDAAMSAIEQVRQKGKVPIVVGGSGMYVSILLDGIFEGQGRDEVLRQQLITQAKDQGPQTLYAHLLKLDPQAAQKIHPHDVKRLVRALEVCLGTGEPISVKQKERSGLWGKEQVQVFGLMRPREILYGLAEARVERMFTQGLVEEVRALGSLTLSPTAQVLIGIKEVQGYLRGEYDMERVKYLLKRNTRHYIKRQMTWFRRDTRIQWIDMQGQDVEAVAHRILAWS